MFRLRTSQKGLTYSLTAGRLRNDQKAGRSLVPPNQRPARYVVRGGGLGPGPNMTVPPLLVAHGGAVPVFIVAYYASALLHEAVHILAACLVGAGRGCLTAANARSAVLCRHVRVPGVTGWRAAVVRHGGWLGSVVFAAATTSWKLHSCVQTAAWLTALDSVCSDLLELEGPACDHCQDMFRCGNFGVIVMSPERRKTAFEILRTMVRITMMRGAQSGGVVTYVPSGGGSKGSTGIRSRVVNGKRTNLSTLVTDKIQRDQFWASMTHGLTDGVRIYAGHTRFATSSIHVLAVSIAKDLGPFDPIRAASADKIGIMQASLDGTHPHQWTPPSVHDYFQPVGNGSFEKLKRTVEVFICHNGDLDFWDIAGVTYNTDQIMAFIERATHSPPPSMVDSAGVAGLIDLVRTAGLWYHSVRFGFLFGPMRPDLDYVMPAKEDFARAAQIAQEVFEQVSQQFKGQGSDRIREATKDLLLTNFSRNKVLGLDMEGGQLVRFVQRAVNAFFDQDLLAAVRFFLANAKGSFGLCITCSLDAHRQLVVAARGQTISVAFYPNSGLILWGSEQAAVKAALVGEKHTHISPMHECARCGYSGHGHEDDGACRLDLDDLGGEVVLIDWGSEGEATYSTDNFDLPQESVMNGMATLTIAEETPGKQGAFKKRLVRLHQNPLIKPLPACPKDPVAKDIADISQVLSDIQHDWDNQKSINNISSWWLGRCVAHRLKEYEMGQHDGSVDILVTGCEVSLWLGEQFCSDLTQVFPRLKIKCISANKLLGLFGQDFPIPQSGHQFHEYAWNLKNTVTLIISHSGGTFGSLAVSNLLQAYTEQIFVVASESDTQVGKQLRQIHKHNIWDLKCPVFTTEVGIRPAEPCSISVAATHQILTQILLYLMRKVQLDGLEDVSGGKYTVEDFKILEDLNQKNISALEEITGFSRQNVKTPTATETLLREKGNYWALHVLETPMSWMMCAAYVLGTVISGYPVVTGLARMVVKASSKEANWGQPWAWNYILSTIDALIYLFLPQLCVLILRAVTGRKFLHRMVGRSVVIGDIPWVAQSIEAYLSKLFACSYSAAGIAVYSGNPADHLVHRMTHRVVRGALLACGRPDGRLMALTSAEASVCLSVNQASSIQSIGSTCESLTVGHNPAPLGLAEHNVFLPGCRQNFLCESVLTRNNGPEMLNGTGANSLLGAYSNMRKLCGHKKMDRSGTRRGGSFHLSGELGFSSSPDSSQNGHIDASVHSFASAVGRTASNTDSPGEGETSEGDDLLETMRLMTDDKPLKRSVSKKDMKRSLRSFRRAENLQTSQESFYGETMENELKDVPLYRLCEEQVLAMRLYESRIASLQRCVAFFVLFHQMAKRVADFWPTVSCGYLGYDTSRTHSIMRIATTASPVSGAEVRDRTMELAKIKRLKNSRNKLLSCVFKRREREAKKAAELAEAERKKKEREALLSMLSPEQRQALEVMSGVGAGDDQNVLDRVVKFREAGTVPQASNGPAEGNGQHTNGPAPAATGPANCHPYAGGGKSGWVKKRGQLNSAFKNRFFVLDASGLVSYYSREEDFNERQAPNGSFSCQGLEVDGASGHTTDGFLFTLYIPEGSRKKKIECACVSDAQRTAWVAALEYERQKKITSPSSRPGTAGMTSGVRASNLLPSSLPRDDDVDRISAKLQHSSNLGRRPLPGPEIGGPVAPSGHGRTEGPQLDDVGMC